MLLSTVALALEFWSASSMAICSLACADNMVQLVGTDFGVVACVELLGSTSSGMLGLEKMVRFDMAGCCSGWLSWHNLLSFVLIWLVIGDLCYADLVESAWSFVYIYIYT